MPSDFTRSVIEEPVLFQRFMALLEAKRIGCSNCFTFRPGNYSTCLDSLEETDYKLLVYIKYRLKCDVVKDSIIFIKMRTTTFHGQFCWGINNLIVDKLVDLKSMSKGATGDLLRNIWAGGDASVPNGRGSSLCPDGQYYFGLKTQPSVVFEIAFSESLAQVSTKAVEYLTFTEGEVRLVINFDCTYHQCVKRLDLHVWNSPTEHVKYEICEGDHVNPGALRIPLAAFGNPAVLAAKFPGANLNKEIIVGFDKLARCYHMAMDTHIVDNEHVIPVNRSSFVLL